MKQQFIQYPHATTAHRLLASRPLIRRPQRSCSQFSGDVWLTHLVGQIQSIYTHQNKFYITSVLQVPEPLHKNEIEIHTNNFSALFIAHENHILHGVDFFSY